MFSFKKKESAEENPDNKPIRDVSIQAPANGGVGFGFIPRIVIGGGTLLGLFLFNTTIPKIRSIQDNPGLFPSGELFTQIAYAIAQGLGLLALIGVAVLFYILPWIRREPAGFHGFQLGKKPKSTTDVSTSTDWNKLRLD